MRKIIGVTVGTPTSPSKMAEALKTILGCGILNVTDDGNGNVEITMTGNLSVTDDGNGNVTLGGIT